MTGNAHVPVLLGPVLEGLALNDDGCYVDATFGRGGHSGAILERLGSAGRLIGIDRDPDAIASAPAAMCRDPRFELIRGEIAELGTLMAARNLIGRVDGILLDLGVSSPQLDEPRRGFSFLRDGPLDMRMDPDAGVSAREWLASVDEGELRRVLREFGEERHARRIAAAIVAARREQAITTTGRLADLVAAAVPGGAHRKHPATKTFQAIRIAVNDELGQLRAALAAAVGVLRKGGRLCVISFHSLEDRIVKRFMREQSVEAAPYRGLPDVPAEYRPKLRLVGKPLAPAAAEIDANRRARSSRLRIAERC